VPDDSTEESAISFGLFRLLPKARLLEKDGVPVHSGARAFDILTLLAGRHAPLPIQSDCRLSNELQCIDFRCLVLMPNAGPK
jgi:hypothetical protein